MMSSIFQIILVGYVKPYDSRLKNLNETINEVMTIFIMYHSFCFTDWLPDASV